VPKNPRRYNPLGDPAVVAGRRDLVLKRMVDLSIITNAQRQDIWAQPAAIQQPGQAPAYLARIRAQLEARYGPDAIEQGGLDVAAAMDLPLQRQAEQALTAGVRRLAPGLEGALVCLDPATGDVLAAVGGVDEAQNGINRAFVSRRQPGSAIKPLIYAAALEQGVTAGSIWSDLPVSYDRGDGRQWRPLNYGNERFGDLSLHQALAHSDNVITVKVLEHIGVPYFVDFAGRMGLPLRAENGLSLALGTDEVTLGDLVSAYTPLATGGNRAVARTILRVHDRRHDTWTENPAAVTPAMEPGAAFITTRMLQDVLVYGTAKNLLKFSREHPSAGKTGTTDSGMDAWFVGYTPQLITGVWVGCDRPRPGGRGFTGGLIAAPIWERFMAKALAGKPAADFVKPDNVIGVAIDPATGHLAAPDAPGQQEEFYLSGTEPLADVPAPVQPAPEPSAPASAPAPAIAPAPTPAPAAASEPAPEAAPS
jgi:membrane carboxypeptidase/penicillin-binding protein